MRAVFDPNVLISALLSPSGTPAQLVRTWLRGAFELVVSPLLLAELRRALAYPKLRARIPKADADAFVAWLQATATLVADPSGTPPARSPDPGDDYLIALAAAHAAVLVTGDGHLLGLGDELPIESPADFVRQLEG